MNKQKQFQLLFQLLLIIFIMSGCALPQKEADQQYSPEKAVGRWEGKAQIKDNKKSTVDRIQIVLIGENKGNIRMEVSSMVGISLATVVIKDKKIQYLLPQQKKYFTSGWTDRAFSPLFRVDLHPKYLFSIAFDRPMDEDGWICEFDSGMLSACNNSNKNIHLKWQDRMGEQKRVVISSEEFEIQVLFKSFTTKVQIDDNLFSLPVPNGYKQYNLL